MPFEGLRLFEQSQIISNKFQTTSNQIDCARKIYRRNQTRRSFRHPRKTGKYQEALFGKLRLPNEFFGFRNRGFHS